jgi:energy-coupling factor transporter ATP-binding protein EcfA2
MSGNRDSRPAIRLRDVAKQFSAGAGNCTAGVAALANASMEIRAGEVLIVCGPRGAGKTTLLLCAAGLLQFDGGEVERGIRRVVYRDVSRPAATVDLWPRGGAILLDGCDEVGVLARARLTRAITDALGSGSAVVIAGRDPERCLALAPEAATISVIHLRRGAVTGGRSEVAIHRVAEVAGGSY